MKALIEAHYPKCHDLEFIEVMAAGDNLDFCSNHDIESTPAVIIFTGGDYWGPYCEPVIISEKLEGAQKKCEKEKERTNKALESS